MNGMTPKVGQGKGGGKRYARCTKMGECVSQKVKKSPSNRSKREGDTC